MTKAEIAAVKSRAREHINSVGYSVSLRWVFYRLLQDGIYNDKDDYGRLKALTERWRHFEDWPPDILADDTREAIYRAGGSSWKPEEIPEQLCESIEIYFHQSHFYEQDVYCELWYEARAMTGQFEKYTDAITLRPFAGDTSIPMKWNMAKDLEKYAEEYGKSIKILYFGDCDQKGKKIFEAATYGPRGFAKWCSVMDKVEVIHCGLTLEQVEEYGVPENPAHPGQYQWEALTDTAAKAIITEAMEKYLNLALIAEAWEAAREKAEPYIDGIYEVFEIER